MQSNEEYGRKIPSFPKPQVEDDEEDEKDELAVEVVADARPQHLGVGVQVPRGDQLGEGRVLHGNGGRESWTEAEEPSIRTK